MWNINFYSKLFFRFKYDLTHPKHRNAVFIDKKKTASENASQVNLFFRYAFCVNNQQLQRNSYWHTKKIYILIVFTNPKKKFRQFLQVVYQRLLIWLERDQNMGEHWKMREGEGEKKLISCKLNSHILLLTNKHAHTTFIFLIISLSNWHFRSHRRH